MNLPRPLAASLLLGAAVFATAAQAEFVPVDGPRRVVDGDTFVIDRERIRLLDVDTPERGSRSRCLQERVVAIRATNRLRELLGDGPLLIERHGRDKYGRTLAYVFAAGQHEIGEMLVAEGLAVEWNPSRAEWLARARWWCHDFVEGARP